MLVKMGYSRDTFYHFKELYARGSEATLQEISRKQPIKNRVAPQIEQAVIDLAIANPALGQLRASNELKQQACQFQVWNTFNLVTK